MSQNSLYAVPKLTNPRVTKSFRVKESLWEKIKTQAIKDKRTLSSTMEIVLEKGLSK